MTNIRTCGSKPMAMHQISPQSAKLTALDPIWDRVRTEAEDIVRREPELASFIYSTVLHHDRLEDSVVHRLADRLDHSALSGVFMRCRPTVWRIGCIRRAARILPIICRAAPRRYSRPTSIPQPGLAAGFSWITPPGSYAVRPL